MLPSIQLKGIIMSRFPVYRDYKMVQPTAQSWEARESPLPAQFVPTYYKAADLRFKRFLDDILASNYYYQSQMYNVHLLMTEHY